MAKHMRSLSTRARLVYGTGCIALGCFPILASLGIVPIDETRLAAPAWVFAGAGLLFVIAGFMFLLAHHSRANDLLAGVLLMLFGILGAWISLLGSSEGFSGGLPILAPELNTLVARWVFGLGALISFALSAWAFRRVATGQK